MQTRVERVGDRLAIPLPAEFVGATGLREDSLVDVMMVAGELVVRPAAARRPPLKDLLDRITDENLHGEVDTGPPVGAEAW
jgi:antitoxin MazE